MSLISFNWNNKLLFIIIQSIIIFICKLKPEFNIFDEKNNLIENIYNRHLSNSFYIFCILFYLISNIQNNNKSYINYYREKNSLIIESKKKTPKNYFSIINFLILIVILIFLNLFDIFCIFLRKKIKVKEFDYNLEGFLFLIVILFSYFLLKIQIYKHQIFSIIISVFCSIIFLILKVEIKSLIYTIFDFINLGLKITLFKFLMIHFFFSPYLILFFEGIISFFICFSIEIYNLIFKKEILTLIFIEKKYFYFVFLFNFIIAILNIIIIYYFSPIFEILAYILFSIIFEIKNFISDKNESKTNLILHIFYLICCLIITEIVVLNFWGLNKNTVFNINKRIREEEFDLFKNETGISFSLFKEENKENNKNEE